MYDRIDFTEASMAEAKLVKFESVESVFIRNNFFKTMLANVDFSKNEFAAPFVSAFPAELKGAIISSYQAAELIGLIGVVVSQK